MCRARWMLLLEALIILSAICAYLCLRQKTRVPARPNIIVIIADDLGWNDVSFHGADEIPTPNIDALAYNGVILNRHYVQPICTPSRTAFLTGMYPIRTGMQGWPLGGAEPRGIPLNYTLLPEYLQRLGYATHLVGKWHVGYHTRNYGPTRRGFDTFLGYYNGYIEYFSHMLCEDEQCGYDLHRIVADNHSMEYNYEYMTDLVTREAESIISSHDPAKPLYLQLAHLAAHSTQSREVMEIRDWHETNATLGYIQDVKRRKYASVVATLDESVGRVVNALGRAELLADSIIVFLSDNGAQTVGYLKNYGSNYPLRGLKHGLFEGGVRGAACVYSPLIDSPSRVSTQLFHITDWLPTLYSAAGGDSSDLGQLDGVNQWPAIKSAASAGKRNSILLNIDEKENSEAALTRYYKIVKDNTRYQGYYGAAGDDANYPKYNVTSVLTSPTASAIARISAFALDASRTTMLRRKATVTCNTRSVDSKARPNCSAHPCLFNVRKDPCETTDLSSQYLKVAKRLSAFIDSYKSVLVKQTNAPVDPAGFPRNFNGTWIPWLPDDYQSIGRAQHLATSEAAPS